MKKDLTGPVIEAEAQRFIGLPQGFQDRIENLARVVEGLLHVNDMLAAGETFSMAFFYKDLEVSRATCGTASCLAGWAHAMYRSAVPRFQKDPIDIGSEVLGIDLHTAHRLFTPNLYLPINLVDITPQQAAAALRRVARGARTAEEIWGYLA